MTGKKEQNPPTKNRRRPLMIKQDVCDELGFISIYKLNNSTTLSHFTRKWELAICEVK